MHPLPTLRERVIDAAVARLDTSVAICPRFALGHQSVTMYVHDVGTRARNLRSHVRRVLRA